MTDYPPEPQVTFKFPSRGRLCLIDSLPYAKSQQTLKCEMNSVGIKTHDKIKTPLTVRLENIMMAKAELDKW